jgi:prevent-host-death family protein
MKADITGNGAPKTVNIHDAKTHLSQLIHEASQGSSFIIAKAGKPMVKVISINQESKPRTGMLTGVFSVPDDIDAPFQDEIAAMFGA